MVSARGDQVRILLVEDEAFVYMSMKDMLVALGHKMVAEATNWSRPRGSQPERSTILFCWTSIFAVSCHSRSLTLQ